MPPDLARGDAVQTPFGKGVILELRNKGRLLVEVHGRALEVRECDVSALDAAGRSGMLRLGERVAGRSPQADRAAGPAVEVDLHGLTVEEALTRAEEALNDALLANALDLRLIHGRSGGRIRAALHKRLREISSIRGFHLDPGNDGVTIVRF